MSSNVSVGSTPGLYIGSGSVQVLNSAQQLLTVLDNNGNVNFALDPATNNSTVYAYFVGNSGGGGGSYGNTQVAAYLPTYTGSLANSSDIIALYANAATQNTQINLVQTNLTSFETYANATFSTGGGSSYGNVNVAAYLSSGVLNSNIITGADVIAGSVLSNNYLYANGVPILNSVNTNIQTLSANLGAFEIYANATFSTGGGSSYGNANVAAYLPTYSGSLANSSDIIALYANAGAQATSINSLTANAATQETEISGLRANVTAANAAIVTVQTNLTSFETYANATFATGGSSNYGNTNVAAYLSSGVLNSNIITGADVVAAAMYSNNYLYANGVSILTGIGGTYSNANVQAYLAANTDPTISNLNANAAIQQTQINTVTAGLATLNANVGAYETYANATFATQTNLNSFETYANATFATQTSVQTLSANVGAFEIYANANLGTATNNITTLFANAATQETEISGLRANITAANAAVVTVQNNLNVFETYANATFLTASTGYGNANVAAYLPLYSGTLGGNITIGGNLTVQGNIISNNYDEVITGLLVANSTTAATSTTTGALQSYGGAGIQGNLFAGAVYTNTYNYANGVSIFSAISSNAATLQTEINTVNANVTAANSAIATLNANVGAFETYANATFLTATTGYANANVAAYLSNGIGTNIVTTANLNAGNVNVTNLLASTIANIGYVDFTPQPSTVTTAKGSMWYNNSSNIDGMVYYNSAGQVLVGQQTYFRAYNNTGSTMPAGQVVYVNGQYIGQYPTIANALATSSTTSLVIGIVPYAIPNNSFGEVISAGRITTLSGLPYATGTDLFLSAATPGGLTSTQPTNPNYAIQIGVAISSTEILLQPTFISVNANNVVGVFGNITTLSNVTAGNLVTTNGVYWANGISYASTVPGTYGNANVATYLPNYTGSIGNSGTPAGTGYFTNVQGTLTTAAQPNVTSISGYTNSGGITEIQNSTNVYIHAPTVVLGDTSYTDIIGVNGTLNVIGQITNSGNVTANSFVATANVLVSSTTGAFSLGALTQADTGVMASLQTNTNGYAYLGLQNTNAGTLATTDIAFYNDTANLGVYMDVGINSSGYAGTGNLNKANSGYVYTGNADLSIGTYYNNPIHFVVNNGATDAMTIASNGTVSIGQQPSTTIVQTITTSGTWTAPAGLISANVLIIGGGGGGGIGGYNNATFGLGGGGGAGGVIFAQPTITAGTTYNITIGAGGAGGIYGASPTAPANGGNTVAFGYTAIGGGQGGSDITPSGTTGGSGGGAHPNNTGSATAASAGTSGQGYAGGASSIASTTFGVAGGGGGGGGQAYAAYVNWTGTVNRDGGAPYFSLITGANVGYAEGGGGAISTNSPSYHANGYTATTYGSGGGGGYYGNNGTAGQAGAVIIQYTVANYTGNLNVGNVFAGTLYTYSGLFWSNGVSILAPGFGNTDVQNYLSDTINLQIANSVSSSQTVIGNPLTLSPGSSTDIIQNGAGFIVGSVGGNVSVSTSNGLWLTNTDLGFGAAGFGGNINFNWQSGYTQGNINGANVITAQTFTTSTGVFWANGSPYGSLFSGNLGGSVLYDSVNQRVFANAYPLSKPYLGSVYKGSLSNNTFTYAPVYVNGVLQAPTSQGSNQNQNNIAVGFVQSANVSYTGSGQTSQNRITTGVALYTGFWPQTGNSFSLQDRVYGSRQNVDMFMTGQTYGPMVANTTTAGASTIGAAGPQVTINGYGNVSSVIGVGGSVQVIPSSGGIANVLYATGSQSSVSFNTINGGTANVQYARLFSGCVASFSSSLTCLNAIGLHTFSGWAGTVGTASAGAQRAYSVLNEDSSTIIQTNGNIVINNTATTGYMQLGVFTVAQLAATGVAGQIVAVSNGSTGGQTGGSLAYWDTTNNQWSWVSSPGTKVA